MYQLKRGQETFQVVDGPDAGKTFERGRAYESFPAGDAHRFERVPVPKINLPDPAKPDKTREKKS